MIAIIGKETKKVYVKGDQAYCFRTLHEKYPYKNGIVYPEPLLVVNL
ncbi:hypothetical protein A21D_03539 [Virgibacillus dokdonensis]|uniref:Uncharacterized protein n=1 Tax=Virgibacillus dokdonensis TaxID=302167 RepID=A0A2K9J5W8_9BACI|nr:hypothetical protein A21D_03539 [Virgibacillus dokdonensis]